METNSTVVKYHMHQSSLIRVQVILYCHMNGYFPGTARSRVSFADIDCLTLLGMRGKTNLISFCKELVGFGVFKSVQSVRNAVSKLQDKNLISKEGRSHKIVFLNPDMKVLTDEAMTVNFLLSTDIKQLKNVSPES
jgi:hypothetical protein